MRNLINKKNCCLFVNLGRAPKSLVVVEACWVVELRQLFRTNVTRGSRCAIAMLDIEFVAVAAVGLQGAVAVSMFAEIGQNCSDAV
jgi:predicted small integral membrane protein